MNQNCLLILSMPFLKGYLWPILSKKATFWLDFGKNFTVLVKKKTNFDQLKVRKLNFKDFESIFKAKFWSRNQVIMFN